MKYQTKDTGREVSLLYGIALLRYGRSAIVAERLSYSSDSPRDGIDG